MSRETEADVLARELFETRARLRAAGRVLHDQIGPLLSAAGIRLDLARIEYPQAAPAVQLAVPALDEAMELVRSLSRELNPPPAAHLGLKKALGSLIEAQQEACAPAIGFRYTASAQLPEPVAAALYEAAAAVLARACADRSTSRLSLAVSGARSVRIRIESNRRLPWPASALAAVARRARPAGVTLASSTKKSTIVSIRYAPRRSPSG